MKRIEPIASKLRAAPQGFNAGERRTGGLVPFAQDRPSPRGFVLIAVLIVVMLASMVALSLLFHQRAEETAAAAGSAADKAWAAAMSGVYEAMRIANSPPGELVGWDDNPEAFHERLCLDDGAEKWYFTVYSQGDSELQTVRFGLADEAAKLNVNTATETMLSRLPNLTPYLVEGLLDFLDADNTPRPEGAEQEYYNTLAKAYTIRNGPLATLEEILLVRGFTPDLFYGEDANLNGQLDPGEDDAEEQFPPDNKDGKLDSGLRRCLTVSSYDLNQDAEGKPRTDLNDAKDAVPDKDLPAKLLEYITALRRNKVTVNHPADLLEARGKFKDEKGQEIELESGVGKADLAAVLDRFTATSDVRLPGLINVNTASASVLQTLPDVDVARAESIVAARQNLRSEQRSTPAWLYEESLVDADLFKKLAPLVTARALQFHLHVVGYGVPSGRFRVLEAIIDLGGPQPVISYLRDITRLGLPFKIEVPSEESTEPVVSQAPAAGPPPAPARAHLTPPPSNATHG